MRICILQSSLDSFKGGNHLPLFAALKDVECVIVTQRCKLDTKELPKNVSVQMVPRARGPYYYGIADAGFASQILASFPADSVFWKQFDVIHINQVCSARLLRLRETRKPIVYAVHHPVTADRQVAVEESGLFGRILWNLRYARLCREQKKLCIGFSSVMTVSYTVQKRLRDDYGCDETGISVVPNGVDTQEFSPSSDPPLQDVIAIGSLLHPRKGFRYLADTYEKLSRAGFRIADVGRRSAVQQARLKEIPNVTVHGTVSREELLELLQRSRVLLSASLYEGFGLSLIEALACGVPVVAFGAGAVPEVLEKIRKDFVVGIRDTEALAHRAETIVKLAPQAYAQLSAEIRRSVTAAYPISAAAEALQNLYRSLVEGQKPL